jgi:predicted ATPase
LKVTFIEDHHEPVSADQPDVGAAWDRLEERSLSRLRPDEREAYARTRALFPGRGRPRQDATRPEGKAEPLTPAQRQALLRSRQRLLELMAVEAGCRSPADLAAALLREPANLSRLHEVSALSGRPYLLSAIQEGRVTAEDVRSIAEEILRAAYRRWRLPLHPASSPSWSAFTPLGPPPVDLPASGRAQAMLLIQPIDGEGSPLPLQHEPDDFDYLVRLGAGRFGSLLIARRDESWGFLVVFPDVTAAVGAARSIRRDLAAAAPPIRFRMAIHVGTLTGPMDGFPSRDLHIGEALLLLAGVDQVLVTAAARRALRESEVAARQLHAHGLRILPILQTEDVYELDAPAEAALPQAALHVTFQRVPAVPFIAFPDLVGRGMTSITADRARVVTFVGPSGAGATRVALQVATALSRRFASIHYVDLAAMVDRMRVARFVAETLQVPIQGPGLDALASVIRHLREGPTLLVLDSCDRALVECRRLVEDLLTGCPSLIVLATATEPLSLPGEAAVHLRHLSLPTRRDDSVRPVDLDSSEAGRLFITRARQVNPAYTFAEAEAGAVVRICELVQGLPIAIELLATMAAVATAAPAELARELEEYLWQQTGTPAPALPRDRLLQLTISWRLRKLHEQSPELERSALLLSLFPADFDPAAARAVCARAPQTRFGETLRALVRQGFVQALPSGTGTRYRVLKSIRLECEARRRYDESLLAEIERARTAFARHFAERLVATVDAVYGPDQQRWIELLKREIPNFRAALAWSQADAEDGATWVMLCAAYARFLLQIGHAGEAEEIVEDALRRSRERDHVRLRLLSEAGLVAWRRGDLARARERWAETVEVAVRLEDPNDQARALDQLATLAIAEGDLARAEQLCQAGLEIAQRIQSLSRLSFGHFHLGLIELRRGELAAAREHLETSLAMREGKDHPNRLRAASSLLGLVELAVAESRAGRDARATGREHLRRALEIYARGSDRSGIASALCLGAVLLIAEGELEGAVRLHAAAQRILADMGQDLSAIWKPLVEAALDDARKQLSPHALRIAEELGRKLDDAQAVAYAQELLGAPGIGRGDRAGGAGGPESAVPW